MVLKNAPWSLEAIICLFYIWATNRIESRSRTTVSWAEMRKCVEQRENGIKGGVIIVESKRENWRKSYRLAVAAVVDVKMSSRERRETRPYHHGTTAPLPRFECWMCVCVCVCNWIDPSLIPPSSLSFSLCEPKLSTFESCNKLPTFLPKGWGRRGKRIEWPTFVPYRLTLDSLSTQCSAESLERKVNFDIMYRC